MADNLLKIRLGAGGDRFPGGPFLDAICDLARLVDKQNALVI